MQNSQFNLLDDLSRSYKNSNGFMPNDRLLENWKQLRDTVDTMLAPRSSGIVVCQMPTGSGKTHLISRCLGNCLPKSEDGLIKGGITKGVLVVVKFIEEGCKLADKINIDLVEPVALAYNSDTSSGDHHLGDYPVLIITAVTYESLLLEKVDDCRYGKLQTKLMMYGYIKRCLTIIDESYSFVKNFTTDLESLKQVRAVIPESIAKDFTAEMVFIDELIKRMTDVGALDMFAFKRSEVEYKFTALSARISGVKLRHVLVLGDDVKARIQLAKMVSDILEIIHRISISSCLVERSGNRIKIGMSISLVPDNANSNILILDATANLYPLYEHMGDQVQILPRIDGSRDYSNVTVAHSSENVVGKNELSKNYVKHMKCLGEAIKQSVSPLDDLLIICPKIVSDKVDKLNIKAKSKSIGTWGAIDGKNNWIEVNSVFILGLPYRDNFSLLLEYFALIGQQSLAWLKSSNDNEGDRKSVVRKIKQGHLVCAIIQALNRCQIRTSINSKGLCPVTNICLPLGDVREGDFILNAIQTEMPNTQFKQRCQILNSKGCGMVMRQPEYVLENGTVKYWVI